MKIFLLALDESDPITWCRPHLLVPVCVPVSVNSMSFF